MDRPSDSQKPSGSKAPQRTPEKAAAADSNGSEVVYNLNTLYLAFYNWISAVLWAGVLGRVALTLLTKEYTDMYSAVGWLAKWTQTLAAAEIMHSALRIVRAPLLTTIIQVSSRFLLVWLIVDPFPYLAISSPAYSSMLLAWSVTEVVRYSYFTATLVNGAAPDALKWLRYNGFMVLYPLGIASEVCMIWLARKPARAVKPWYEMGLWAVLGIYVPGSYILFTHMIAQRRKVMKSMGKQKVK